MNRRTLLRGAAVLPVAAVRPSVAALPPPAPEFSSDNRVLNAPRTVLIGRNAAGELKVFCALPSGQHGSTHATLADALGMVTSLFGERVASASVWPFDHPDGELPVFDNPDAALIALCERVVADEAEYRRLVQVSSDVQDRCGCKSSELDEAEAAIDAFRAPSMDRMEAIVGMPACTAAGLRAKARVAHAYYDPEPPDGSIADALMWSVLEAVAGVAT